MIIAIPNIAIPEPTMSQAVGRIPSTAHNNRIATNIYSHHRPHILCLRLLDAGSVTTRTLQGRELQALIARLISPHTTIDTADNSR